MKDNILILSELTIPYSSGAGINAFNFAKVLSEKSCKVKMLTFNWGCRYNTREIIDDVIIRRVFFSYNKYFNRLITLFWFMPYFVIHLFLYKSVLIYGKFPGLVLIVLLGKLLRRKVIFQSTALGHDDLVSLIGKRKYLRWVFNKLFAYFSLTPAFTAIYEQALNNKNIRLFESVQGVDVSKFKTINSKEKLSLKKKLQLPLNTKIIITIGNLIRRKGFEEIFWVLSKFKEDFIYIVLGNTGSNKEFYFWQNKDEMKNLFDLGNRLLKDKILFRGQVKNVEEYLKVSDILLLNSEKEGLPNAILEAMSCSVLPLIKRIEGLEKYILSEENAVVFETVNEMGKFLGKIFMNDLPIEKMKNNGSRFIQKYAMHKVAERFIKEIVL